MRVLKPVHVLIEAAAIRYQNGDLGQQPISVDLELVLLLLNNLHAE
jgi:hypothetical protein